MLIASLIVIPFGALAPSSMMSSKVVFLLGGLLLSVIVPAMAYCLLARS